MNSNKIQSCYGGRSSAVAALAILAAVAAGSLLTTQSAQAAPCALTDVSLTIGATTYNPASCADGVAQGGGPTAETASLNSELGTSGFVYLDKSDDAGNPTGLGGITFQVGTVSGNSGTWTVTWTDVAGPPDLPLVLDLAVGLFAGNNASGYLFEDVLLPITPNTGTGTFDINFVNNGGQQPTISHLLLAGGDPRLVVPEPGTLALLGSALLGFGILRRRKRA